MPSPSSLSPRTKNRTAITATLCCAAQSRQVPSGYMRVGQALIHCEARVDRDAVITGPVVVNAGARIKSQAVVVGPTSIGCDAVVETGAFVFRTAVWRRALVGEHAVADRCLIADDALIPARSQALKRTPYFTAAHQAPACPS